ncbi:MAG TPA: hypothetical protein PK280_18590 [Planctomycetota bacterium]|nr:hypothetical protein [Planctomycetota bacterium]
MIAVKRLTRVAPLRAGLVLGLLYAALGMVFIPVFLLMSAFGPAAPAGMLFILALPVLYGIVGFIGGVIMAALYNVIAKSTGGLELEFIDAMTKHE